MSHNPPLPNPPPRRQLLRAKRKGNYAFDSPTPLLNLSGDLSRRHANELCWKPVVGSDDNFNHVCTIQLRRFLHQEPSQTAPCFRGVCGPILPHPDAKRRDFSKCLRLRDSLANFVSSDLLFNEKASRGSVRSSSIYFPKTKALPRTGEPFYPAGKRRLTSAGQPRRPALPAARLACGPCGIWKIHPPAGLQRGDTCRQRK